MKNADTTNKVGLLGGMKNALFGEKGLFYPGSWAAFKKGWDEAKAEANLNVRHINTHNNNHSDEWLDDFEIWEKEHGFPHPNDYHNPVHRLYWGNPW